MFDDSDNTGVDPTISNHGTGDLLLQAGANNKIIYLQTANSSGTLTNRLLIGATVSKDAGNNSSQSGVKIDGDIYATADISADGDVAASLASDIRLKENVTPIKDALVKVNQLSGNTFKWKDCATYNGDDVGVIAQEVQDVLPEAVKEVTPVGGGESHLTVNYHALTSILIESIKELKKEIDEAKDVGSGKE